MKKKRHINADEIRNYLNDKQIPEQTIFGGRASKKRKEILNEIFLKYTDVKLLDDGKRVEFTWDNSGQTFQTDLPEKLDYSQFRSVDDFVSYANNFIDLHNSSLEKANSAREAMKEFTKHEHRTYATLQRDADAEIDRLNTIRKQRELNLADMSAESLTIFSTYGKALTRLSDLAKERMKQQSRENDNEQER